MSAVDVLAVMDREIACEHVPGFIAEQLAEARAAVAELVEADKEYDAARESLNNPAPVVRGWFADLKYQDAVRRFNIARDRRAAALARITGAGA